MPLSPDEVGNRTFGKPLLGKPGYREDEADDFLGLVEAELAWLVEENTELRNLVVQLGE